MAGLYGVRGSLILGWSPAGRGNGGKHSLLDGSDVIEVAVAEVVCSAGRENGQIHSLLATPGIVANRLGIATPGIVANSLGIAAPGIVANRPGYRCPWSVGPPAPGNCAANVQSCFNACIIMRVGEKILHIANLLNNLLTDSCDGQPHSMWRREHYDSQTFKRI